MTLLDEAKGLGPVPPRVGLTSYDSGRYVTEFYVSDIEQRLAIAVRALRASDGISVEQMSDLADALQVLPPTERSKDTI